MTKSKKKKEKKLKPKEVEFAKKYVQNNKNGGKTVKEVYGVEDDNYARLKAHRLITNDNISQAIQKEELSLKQALIKKGVTPEKIADKVGVLLDAVDKEGNSDYNAVDKGLKHATNIFGVEDITKPKGNVYNFFNNPTFQQNIKSYDQNFKDQILKTHNVTETKTTEETLATDE